MISKKIGSVLKTIFFKISSSLLRKTFDKLVYRFAGIPRAQSKIGLYSERLVNYVNRELITKEHLEKVWCQNVAGKQSIIYDYLFLNKITQPLDYLEFGVYRGDSIGWWLERLNYESNLYGFDSFEGLNEDWY